MNSNFFIHEPTNKAVISEIRNKLPFYLTEKRLSHTISVEKEALCIANMLFEYIGIDKKYLTDISASALLHDITKKLSLEEHLSICERFGIETDYISACSCNLLHSKTAAYLAKSEFKINDIVFSSIYNHTTGNENMNVFDKIIFLADYIEPERTHKSCIDARASFYNNIDRQSNLLKVLDNAVLNSLSETLIYLLNTGKPVDMQTIKARNYLLTHVSSDQPERNYDNI